MLLVELIKTKYLIGIGKRNNDLWGVKAVLNVQQIVCDSCLVNFYSMVKKTPYCIIKNIFMRVDDVITGKCI